MSLHDDHDDAQYIHDYPQRTSIDLTLELERQLDSESLPTSPADPRFHIDPLALDSSVLASLVTQLRLSVVEVEKERDELKAKLNEAQRKGSGLEDALESASDKCALLEEQLAAAITKSQEEQDAVIMLRGKLEDSRRALMRLQTESRRMSQVSNLTLDLSRAGPTSFNGPPSSRRSSFVPLTGSSAGRGNAHRRIVSVSEPGSYQRELGSPTPTSQFDQLQLSAGPMSAASGASRRLSGFFGRASPTPDLQPTQDATEVEELKKELQTVKEHLEETRHELTEAREAQEASETCVRALRTFISENSIGMQPPTGRIAQAALPTMPNSGNVSSTSRWGFKLWNTPSTSSTPTSSPALSSSLASAPVASTPTAPIARKLGGFFSSRANSISSTASLSRPEPHSHQQEPTCNGSDSSSLDSGTEPISPSSEMPPMSILVDSGSNPSYTMSESPEQHSKALSSAELAHRLENTTLA
ncbi:hypothetical protein PHLGIDRAFT_19689 [Phlebiopsis gigantea 11061_1 CR5-6]|uniref:Uncharacterized protein n=1 Tax=Phlebiopsis gigantea (strain 11061_1 CR5-6) TaxID=745531 RepID=A0A0C3S8M8_PHLG1|nr:hypothetical protein PHLGIDRAFT_19689 [Phlebiopsis gigantea 11061_1 CR5-6]